MILRLLRHAVFLFCLVQFADALNCSDFLTTVELGYLLPTKELNAVNFTFQPQHYQQINNTHFRVCICLARTCMRKCCPPGHGFRLGQCKQVKTNFSPIISDSDYLPVNDNVTLSYHWTYGYNCEKHYAMATYFGTGLTDYVLLENSTLLLPNATRGPGIFDVEDYCMDNYIGMHKIYDTAPVICAPKSVLDYPVVYVIGFISSIPCLLLTLVVYTLMPAFRNLHGRCLVSHVTALSVFFIAFVYSRLGPKHIPSYYCVALATLIAYASLCAFFWLNVMCFDMWWRMSAKIGRRTVFKTVNTTFLFYSLYAWGIPFLMMGTIYLLDSFPQLSRYIDLPEFSKAVCWFATKKKALEYHYGPIGVLLLTNIGFFIATASHIYRSKSKLRDTGLVVMKGGKNGATSDTTGQQGLEESAISVSKDSARLITKTLSDLQKESLDIMDEFSEFQGDGFSTYLKLFLVMGVNWLIEVIDQFDFVPQGALMIPIAFNTFQGVLIFVICVLWKPQVRQLFKERVWSKIGGKFLCFSTIKRRTVRAFSTIKTKSTSMTD